MQTFEERLITAILTQAVEDAKYTGLSKKYLRHKIEAVNSSIQGILFCHLSVLISGGAGPPPSPKFRQGHT